MRLTKLLKALLPSLVSIPAKADADVVARKLVRSYARGNVNLQYGRYLTSKQLEARKQKLAQHSF
ncbi:hypothetical protein ACVSMR_05665 [Pseudomonas aeruginosa]